jgi:Outer membrane lipoprotein carrier protein LolA-like
MRVCWPLGAIGLLLATTAPLASAQSSTAWGLEPLMQSLAQVHAASAEFTETKTMAVLKTPLQTSGTLRYVAPDYLRKTVLAPTRQDFVLQNAAVTLTTGGKTQQFNLSQAPPLAGLVEGVRATLAGDLPTLQRYYTIALSGSADTWQLLLRPRDAGLSHVLSWLSIRGSENRVTEIDTGGAGGDLTRMSVDETIDHAP